jgi:hypothetical protein
MAFNSRLRRRDSNHQIRIPWVASSNSHSRLIHSDHVMLHQGSDRGVMSPLSLVRWVWDIVRARKRGDSRGKQISNGRKLRGTVLEGEGFSKCIMIQIFPLDTQRDIKASFKLRATQSMKASVDGEAVATVIEEQVKQSSVSTKLSTFEDLFFMDCARRRHNEK